MNDMLVLGGERGARARGRRTTIELERRDSAGIPISRRGSYQGIAE